MNRRNRIVRLVLVSCLLVGTLTASGGCYLLRFFGDNFTLNVVVPLGLGGNAGLYNPFGILTALVTRLVGTAGQSGNVPSGGGGGAGGTTVPPPLVTGT